MLIKAYTDGSACVKGINKGRGGFGTYFPDLFGKIKAYSSGYWVTKTGRMELTALLYAIRAIPLSKSCTLKVFSDSEYVVKTFTEKRLERWVLNNWTSYGNDIKNIDLWKKVMKELNARTNMNLIMQHIKGHQIDKEKCPKKKRLLLQNPDIVGNMMADCLADYKRFKENELKTDLLTFN